MKVKVVKSKHLMIHGEYLPKGKVLTFPDDLASRLIGEGTVAPLSEPGAQRKESVSSGKKISTGDVVNGEKLTPPNMFEKKNGGK